MKTAKPWFLIPLVLSAACGLGLGWVLRGNREAPPSGKSVSSFRKPLENKEKAPASDPAANDANLRDRVAAILAGNDDWQMARSLDDLFAAASLGDLKSLVGDIPKLPYNLWKRQSRILDAAGRHMARLDPEDALEFCQNLPDPSLTKSLRRSVLSRWAIRDSDAALAWAKALPKSETRDDCIGMVAYELGKTDPEAALLLHDEFPATGKGRVYLFSHWAETNPQEAARAAESLLAKSDRNEVFKIVARTWAGHDPLAALAWAGRLPESTSRFTALEAAVGTWAREKPSDALAWASDLAEPTLRRSMQEKAFGAWTLVNPQAALAWADLHPDPSVRGLMVRRALEALSSNDPAAAIAAANERPDENLRRSIYSTALSELAEKSPEAALTLARTLPSSLDKNWALTQMAKKLTDVDPAAALTLLQEIPAGSERSNAIRGLIPHLPISDHETANRLHAMVLWNSRQYAAETISRQLAQANVETALAWAQGLSGESRSRALSSATAVWAEQDPKAALKWTFDNNPPIENGYFNPAPVFSKWSKAAPAEALAWLATVPPGKVHDDMSLEALRHLSRNDMPTALAVFDSVLTPEVRRKATHELSGTLAQADPAGAIAWAAKLGDDSSRYSALINIASVWSDADPAAAAAWAVKIEQPSLRSYALAKVSQKWTQSDPAATGVWLNTFPAGQERDGMVGTFASHLKETDPVSAVAWASTLSDSRSRDVALSDIARNWLFNDPEAAKLWIETTDQLSAEGKKRLLGK